MLPDDLGRRPNVTIPPLLVYHDRLACSAQRILLFDLEPLCVYKIGNSDSRRIACDIYTFALQWRPSYLAHENTHKPLLHSNGAMCHILLHGQLDSICLLVTKPVYLESIP